MPALDTNVLVRHVVQDDSGQFADAKRLIDRCVREGQSLFVPVTVTLELEWVLRASFGFARDEVLQVLSNLFSAAELSFESERALEVALHLYRKGTAWYTRREHSVTATRQFTVLRERRSCDARDDDAWRAFLPVLRRDLRGQIFFR